MFSRRVKSLLRRAVSAKLSAAALFLSLLNGPLPTGAQEVKPGGAVIVALPGRSRDAQFVDDDRHLVEQYFGTGLQYDRAARSGG